MSSRQNIKDCGVACMKQHTVHKRASIISKFKISEEQYRRINKK